jgi:signal transduction histidine kinase/ligand-binding sensor domain-containing protein/DNA-binding response OmpR family regulator
VFIILSYQTFPQTHIPEKIQFKHLGRKDGLSEDIVRALIQDSKGFMWIGTYDGLNRYDGQKFKVFKRSPEDPNSLGANGVEVLFEDRSGTLWVGTMGGGLNRYNPEQENFTRYINPENANFILSIYEDKSSVLWIGASHGGLSKFDPVNGQFTCYKNIPGDSTSLSHNKVWSIYEDSKDNLWVGTSHGGLNKFDRINQKFTRYLNNPRDSESLSNNWITGICEDKAGTIWLSTFGGGLNKLNYKDDRHQPVFTRFKHDPNNPASLSGNDVAFMYIDENDIIWLAADGLNRTISSGYDNSSPSFISYKHNTNDPTSLLSNIIQEICQDNSGLLWVGGIELNIYNTKQKQFKHYKHEPDYPNSLSGNDVAAVYEDKAGLIWLCTWDGGLNKWDRRKNKFTNYKHNPNDPASLSTNSIKMIYEDRDGNLWLGTGNSGLIKFDRKTEKFYTYKNDPLNPRSISENTITSIDEDKSGTLWIGTLDNGLNKFDRKSESFTHYNYNPDNLKLLSSNLYSSIYLVDRSGNLWISTKAGGLIAYNSQKDELVHYKYNPNNPNSLSNNNITTVYEDQSGIFWIGTADGGLNKLNKENGQFRHFKIKDGLPSNHIRGILEDDSGNLWIGTNNGLSKFNPLKETFRNYDIEDGLPSLGLVAGCKSKTGEFIFHGVNGFVIFHPDSIKDNTHIPPVYLTNFYLFNKSVPIGYDSLSKRTILSKSITECEEIELNFEDNVFAFEFAALDYHAPNKNKYAYKMEGFDNDWTFTNASRNIATYTNLDPGEYTFRVKGSNNDGIWNEAGASLKMIILPPWWRTNLAYLIYFLLIVSIIYFTWKAQLRRIRIKNEYEMSRFEAQKLHEVDEIKSRFFTNISHEFRTPLTLILGPVKQVMERIKDEKNKDELSIAHKNANKLLGLVNQLLDISKLESGNMKLRTSPTNYIQLLKALTLSFTSYAERKRITLKFNSTEDEIILYLDRDKIEKIITNILSNAFKFTPEGGRIEVTVGKDDKYVSTIISDTGIGIPKEKMSKIFDRFYQVDGSHTREQEGTGIGLALTKELVDLHKGKIEVESEESKGTKFIISIPLGKEHLLPEEISKKEIEYTEEKLIVEPEDDITQKGEPKIDIELFEKETLPLLLIVEDNSDVRKYIEDNLTKEFRTLEAVDGEDGWEKAIEQTPDLIISDVMMPKMDGFRLCEKLKTDERTSHIPVILLTAKAAKEDKLEGFETGADEYIMKPFEPDELRVRIKNLIEQRKRLHEHFQKKGIFEFEQSNITSIDKKFLQKVIGVIRDNISNAGFNVEILTENMAVSRSLLNKKVVSLTGKPPKDLIKRIRLTKAVELIEKKFGNLSEIALEVGFDNPAYFSECFKKQFGVPPSQYQRKA